jgi:aminopeptidase N
LLRDFSAPVRVESPLDDDDLALLLAHDSNAFARWEAGQELMTRAVLAKLAHPEQPYSQKLLEALTAALRAPKLYPAYRALLLSLPAEKVLAERLTQVAPLALQDARDALRTTFARYAQADWLEVHDANATPGVYSPDAQSAGKRALRNLALHMLVAAGGHETLAQQRYAQANNMTDRLAALTALVHLAPQAAAECLADFEQRHANHALAMDKWFMVQATAPSTTATQARALMQHSAFTLRNPNRARSLVFQFCLNNTRGFHAPDGSGYAFWAENVRALDGLNPEVAARLARAMDRWSKMASPQGQVMRQTIAELMAAGGLSRNTHEILHKSLELGG